MDTKIDAELLYKKRQPLGWSGRGRLNMRLYIPKDVTEAISIGDSAKPMMSYYKTDNGLIIVLEKMEEHEKEPGLP